MLVLFCGGMTVFAQTPQESFNEWKKKAKSEFSDYKQQTRKDYEDFRRKANAEYAEFLKNSWRQVKAHKGEALPPEPAPPRQPVDVPDRIPSPTPVPFDDVVPPPVVLPVHDVPLPEIDDDDDPSVVTFQFYHTSFSIHWSPSLRYKLPDIREQSISEAWQRLSSGGYEPLLHDCLHAKQTLSLGDWGYIDFVRQLTKEFFISETAEAVLLQQWLLSQSCYKVRTARTESNRLVLLVPFDVDVFNYSYIVLDDGRYYDITDASNERVYVFDHVFPGEQRASLRINTTPRFNVYDTRRRTIVSTRYPSVSMQTTCNQNLIDFYDHYPRVSGHWDIYASASLSDDVKKQVYPRLREKLRGQTKKQQVDMLLNMVQTGFSYATDQEQFGCERSLFADESLFYPSCDCEDRSILFSILVRDLVGLDVVLLQSPGHLFTAVAFASNVDGHYLDIDGRRYTICDPTYIGAPVGLAMPESVDAKIKVFRLAD
ncbi:MAG: hypothetical protein II793_00565 [Bacteroidales bacterium]|nr:hypothetical protein [Bacteroidales bacterium]